MADSIIKGLTVKIGGDTTELGAALEDVNKKSSSLSSELGQINRLLKLDPSNTELLAQKQKVLADAVSNTSKKLETLKEAEKQVQEQFKRGEVSEEQVRALQREIIATEKKLKSYENAVTETAEAVEKLGDESTEAAKDIDKVGDAAAEAEDKSEDLGSSLDGTLSKGFTAVTALAAAASAAIIGCVEASHEYRTAMGKLSTAFDTGGHSAEAATQTYKELQGILGETDQAVEASSHLAKLADTEEELQELTHALTGVYAVFGASLPLEGLAEVANETAKVGKVTGSFADAINWAADENTDWKKILGTNNKALDAFEKAVAEGEATEDAYTAALEACSDEQERQQLITKTLTKLYGKAADQYKKTNKDVIEANKANEEWNATIAEVGETMTPVVTEVKKFGTELLKNAKEPLKDTAGFLTDKVLPALYDLSEWSQDNIPTIKAGLAGVAAALVTYKVATVAAEVAQKGLKGAIMATEVAQKALNLAQAATPWGLAAVAIGAVVTAAVAYTAATEKAEKQTQALTKEELELMKAADETARAFREQKDATNETAGSITSQMGHVQDLAEELQTLADSSGKVKEQDEARAQFILNELNEALGTEYTMTDGVVQKYAELKENIDAVIQSKTANALLEANNELYVAAIQAEDQALKDLVLSEKDYQAQLAITEEAEKKLRDAQAELAEKTANAKTEADYRALASDAQYVQGLEARVSIEQANLKKKEDAYNEAAVNYGDYSNTIMNYEEAQQAALEGNYDRTVEILKNKSGNYDSYADDVDQATRDAIDALYKEAINAGIEADRTRRNFENGVEGYTEEMVTEAEKGYEDALNEWATAKADAEAVGEDLGGGLSGGMENKRNSLISKARSIVKNIISAFKDEADSNSPSRKMIAFGEDMGEGAEIGLTNTTPDLLRTARKQVQGLMGAYSGETDNVGQSVARGITEKTTARNADAFKDYANENATMLGEILGAIKQGKVIALDGDKLVGGTVNRTDVALGQRRVLVTRGAV